MFGWLRRIRHNLIQDGKTRRYILYAIGEITLVMIGILLALQVNNWNEQRNRTNTAVNLLSEVKEGLILTMSDFWMDLQFMERAQRSNRILIDHISNKRPYHDSLIIHFSRMNNFTRINTNTGGYETLKAQGLDLITNSDITLLLTSYYDMEMGWAIKLDEINQEHQEDQRRYIMNNFHLIPRDQNASEFFALRVAKPIDYDQLLEDPFFMSTLVVSEQSLRGQSNQRRFLRWGGFRILNKIDAELMALRNEAIPDSSIVTFTLDGYPDAREVIVTGLFIYWAQDGVPMSFDPETQQWSAEVKLAKSRLHTYKFIVDDVWMLDPANPDSLEDERGNFNSVIQVE